MNFTGYLIFSQEVVYISQETMGNHEISDNLIYLEIKKEPE
jgi:hypothetical protein